jgi:Helix-turn-helix domain
MTPPARPASPEAEYLTPADVATLLKVSLKSIYRWVGEDPSMPAIWLGRGGGPRKRGGTLRFPRQRLLLWLKAKEQGLPGPRLRKPLASGPQVRVATRSGPRERRVPSDPPSDP